MEGIVKVELKKKMQWDEQVKFAKGLKGTLNFDGPQGWPLFKVDGVGSGFDIAFDNEDEIFKYFKIIK